jgi:hypothetical protein
MPNLTLATFVQFTVSDGLTNLKLTEARRLAVADAKSTAREYAEVCSSLERFPLLG